ncbi:hypothetical protein [Methylobacterium brachiatum]|nr:hypothetical protein [Methylobacterium brachiatum]
MLKRSEREWMNETGRPMLEGALSVLVPMVIVLALAIGLNVN